MGNHPTDRADVHTILCHMLTERTQVLLTPAQRQRLQRLADQRSIPVGALIREAIDAYLTPESRSRRRALDDLYSLEAPVSDWETMKSEIEAGALG